MTARIVTVEAANGVTDTYRRFVPLETYDAAVPAALARQPLQLGPAARRTIAAPREVILLDNTGVRL
jgi:hypothetical protein